MNTLEIFDPAMCCSTGVCGPSIDPELLRVSTTINALKKLGIEVKRHNLASEPQDYIINKTISSLLESDGSEILPVTLLNGEVVKTKEYPSNDEFSSWLEVKINSKSEVKAKLRKNDNC